MSGGAALAEPPVPFPATNNSFRVDSPNWLLLNLNVTGYFRVNYNQENWNQLINQLGTNHTVHGVLRAVLWDPTHATLLRLP